jgi:hypothetical protein
VAQIKYIRKSPLEKKLKKDVKNKENRTYDLMINNKKIRQ